MRGLGEICESRCAVDGSLSNLSVWLYIRLILLLEFWPEFSFSINFYAVKDTLSFNIIFGLNLTGLMIFAKFQGLICEDFRSKWSFWLTAANFSWYFHSFSVMVYFLRTPGHTNMHGPKRKRFLETATFCSTYTHLPDEKRRSRLIWRQQTRFLCWSNGELYSRVLAMTSWAPKAWGWEDQMLKLGVANVICLFLV